MRNCTTACVRQPAAKVLRHTADCSGLVRQDLDETVLSATVAADPVSPHWLILTPSKVVRVAMDQVQPAHSAAVTAQSPAASRRPAVSQALSHLTGVLLLMHPPIHPFTRLFIGVFIHPPMPWSCDAFMHAICTFPKGQMCSLISLPVCIAAHSCMLQQAAATACVLPPVPLPVKDRAAQVQSFCRDFMLLCIIVQIVESAQLHKACQPGQLALICLHDNMPARFL